MHEPHATNQLFIYSMYIEHFLNVYDKTNRAKSHGLKTNNSGFDVFVQFITGFLKKATLLLKRLA